MAFQKISKGFRVSTLEDSEEFIRAVQRNFAGLPKEKLLEILTYTGMFYEDGTLKEDFR